MIVIQESEIIKLIFGLGVLIYFFLNRKRLIELPYTKLFLTAYLVVLMGWVLTVVEGFVYADIINFLEHLCYTINSILLCTWCFFTLIKRDDVQ